MDSDEGTGMNVRPDRPFGLQNLQRPILRWQRRGSRESYRAGLRRANMPLVCGLSTTAGTMSVWVVAAGVLPPRHRCATLSRRTADG
jgi:hypothetical protein